MFKKFLIALSCALIFAVLPSAGDQWTKKTVVTFSRPVELPGIALPAGTYVFKLLDSPSDRHIVQVFNADESQILTTILAIPNYRLEPSSETVLRFAERAADSPEAIRAWFYPGDNFGQEFVYPKVRAMNLAAETKSLVLAAPVTPETKPEELATVPVETIAPPKEEAAAPQWTEPVTPVEEAAPAPPPLTPTPAPPPELPKTASPMPLVALLGVSFLTLALVLKRLS